MRPVRIKIALVGDKDSGKTCLLSVYGSNKFPNKYAPRTYENYAYETFLDGNKVFFNKIILNPNLKIKFLK